MKKRIDTGIATTGSRIMQRYRDKLEKMAQDAKHQKIELMYFGITTDDPHHTTICCRQGRAIVKRFFIYMLQKDPEFMADLLQMVQSALSTAGENGSAAGEQVRKETMQ